MFWSGQKTNHTLTRSLTCTAIRLCAWRNTSTLCAPHHTRVGPTRGSLYTCPLNNPNHMSRNPEVVILNARLYKGDLASPSRYDSLFTTLSTFFLSYITELSIGVLTCMHALFVLTCMLFWQTGASSEYYKRRSN
jgi:hypothetical protein